MGRDMAGTGLYFDFVHLVCRSSQDESSWQASPEAEKAPEEFEEPLGQHTFKSHRAFVACKSKGLGVAKASVLGVQNACPHHDMVLSKQI